MSVGQNDMRLAHHLLRHPSGVWHFRLIVPADLHALLGRRVIKKSLGTRDPVVARAWAYALGAQYAQAFAAARGSGARMGSDFDKFVKGLKGYEIEHGPEPHQVKIWTNGTPEDNQAANEALAQLLKLTSVRRTSSAWDEPTPAASPARTRASTVSDGHSRQQPDPLARPADGGVQRMSLTTGKLRPESAKRPKNRMKQAMHHESSSRQDTPSWRRACNRAGVMRISTAC